MASSIKSTKPSLIEKVKSLGATFFSKYTSTKAMNKWIDKTSNQVGLIEVVSSGTTSVSDPCFQNAKIGDIIIMIRASGSVGGDVVADATCPFTPVADSKCMIIRPSKTIL
jgi:restriction endonuclease S subunit